MRAPIEVTLDHTLAPPPAYVRYSHEPFARTDSLDPEGSANVDRSADGSVIGSSSWQSTTTRSGSRPKSPARTIWSSPTCPKGAITLRSG